MRKFLLVWILFIFTGTIVSGQTTIAKTQDGYQLMRNGVPYYVKGVGGHVHMDDIVLIGANSLRTWGIENAQEILDEAHSRGLTVMLGLWLQQERHGFDYNNPEKVKKQFEHFKKVVNQFKDHPALLLWGIGNELDLYYTNPNCWDAVQQIAQYIHQVDPNHPTSTVTAGLDSADVQHILKRCLDIDILGINTYGDIAQVPEYIQQYGWEGPYMITEWGPNGYWESPLTSWKVSLEQTSTEKYQVYLDRYKQFIEPNKQHCLGSYAFLWGAKQEYTETWFGIYSKDDKPTEPRDALQKIFTNKPIVNPAPTIIDFRLNDKVATDNITLKAEEKNYAFFNVKLGQNESNQIKKPIYRWRILTESTDKKAGGDAENEAGEIGGLIKRNGPPNEIVFRAPKIPGQYRLFVSVEHNGKLAYANIPFLVNEREKGEKQARAVQFKYTDMSSFD